MPEKPVSPDALQRVLDGAQSPGEPEFRALARIAAGLGALAPDGPDAFAAARLRRDFVQRLDREPPSPLMRFLGRWLGFGPAPRPLVERLAAGAMLVAIAGGGASAATGENPLSGAADLLRNVVTNLDPRGSGGGNGVEATPSPEAAGETATGTATATGTPTPGASPASAQGTPGQGGGTVAPAVSITPGGAATAPAGATGGTPVPTAAAPVATTTPSSSSTPDDDDDDSSGSGSGDDDDETETPEASETPDDSSTPDDSGDDD
ncbi:MAG: hypothetical protein IT303_20365 [Dehalococcoidia bacterium]|nr:hypothetical protein [Dehalococcoidia bacterium]